MNGEHGGGDGAACGEITGRILAAAMEVHTNLGPGLLESAYQRCLAHELGLRGVPYAREVPLELDYKGLFVDCAYRLDLLVAETVIVEVKAVDVVLPVHEAQLLTYLRLSKRPVGLLLNFKAKALRDGIRRVVL